MKKHLTMQIKEWKLLADKCFLSALSLQKSTNDKFPLVTAFIHLGQLYTQQKKWEKAEKVLKKAILISEQNQDMINLIDGFISLGDCYTQQGKFSQAIHPYRNAEAILQPSKTIEKNARLLLI